MAVAAQRMSTSLTPTTPARDESAYRRGFTAVTSAFLIWGLFPLYIKALHPVPPLQVAAQRLVWGCLFALLCLTLRSELQQLRTALVQPRTRWLLCASAAMISINWIFYVWGVANNRLLETSLGYFVNPLVNVLLGVVVLSERLNRVQWLAVGTAASGVAYLAWSAGQPPWIALVLAFSFGIYGLVRKLANVDSLTGFAGETLLLLPLGLGYLIWCELHGNGAFISQGPVTVSLLIVGGPLTAIPLVLFGFGALRIPYATVGLLQYIGPTMQLLLGVFIYHEPFGGARAVGFTLIWIALAMYATDGLWRSRKLNALRAA
jgi:chloramphenicol-sensitive protein RarD